MQHAAFSTLAVTCAALGTLLLSACAGPVSNSPASTTSTAAAREAPVSPLYWHADAGFGAPEGLLGVGVGLNPTRWSNLELGVGISDSGPVAAGMLGVFFAVTPITKLGASGGVSFGRNSDAEFPIFDSEGIRFVKVWPWVLWVNGELTIRRVLDPQSALRLHLGITVPVAHAEPRCEGPDLTDCDRRKLDQLLPYVGFGYERNF